VFLGAEGIKNAKLDTISCDER